MRTKDLLGISPPKMTADEPPSESLSLWEKLSLIWLIPLFAARVLTFLLFNRNPNLHWRQNLALAYLKMSRATFSAKTLHLQARRTPTGKAIKSYIHQRRIAYSTVTVPLTHNAPSISSFSTDLDDPRLSLKKNVPDPVLHFLTPVPLYVNRHAARSTSNRKTTLLYFHGGGYVNPLRGMGHMPFILSLYKACGAKQTVVLEYALAPEHPYPAQLMQAVATLRYLLTDMLLSPSDIVLAGDSAGGQLVGALLAHLAKPSPYAPAVREWRDGEDIFKAAVFISPWAFMQRPGDLFEADDKWDYLSRGQGGRFQDLWDPKLDDVWANLCGFSDDQDAQEEVWGRVFGRDGKRAMVEKTLVTVGTAEVLLDSCRRFGRECVGGETVVADWETDIDGEIKGKDVVTVECVGEAHVQPALDAALGMCRWETA
ncbi:Alpha/Beta hydrolase protein [Sordaria sp. MPI-SDFR-AT-0083]|nr:Alpha/Beta hydrolase protein [Sordaria sp. MPI-SDFR-AT-0083]